MNGRLTIWIDGREALPVRAIPYVTGERYTPDLVAESLARATAAPFEKLRNLVAYHRPAGRPVQVMTCEWNAVVVQVKGFEAGLHELRPGIEGADDHVGVAAWEKGAALKLPVGVFVWLDEFLREREADHKRTPDDRPVILAPMLDDDTRAAVLEGFEDCPRRGPDADRAMIGYADFVAICQVDDPANFGGFSVEANGLYVDLPPADAILTPEERAAVTWHPTGRYDKPALPLPCTLGQLRAFLPDAGLLGCLDEEAVDAVLGDKSSPHDEEVRRAQESEYAAHWEGFIKDDEIADLKAKLTAQWGQVHRADVAPAVDVGGTVVKVSPCDTAAIASHCAEFRALSNLSANELSIEFVAGESGGVVLNVSARNVKRRLALPELDLFDRRKGEMNIKGNVMLRWAMGERVTADSRKGMPKQIERLRKKLKSQLGIIDNPIMHKDGAGYEPVFDIADKRGAADNRAKREAERCKVSIEELQGRGVQFGDDGQTGYSYETDEEMSGDAADEFLKAHGG